MNVVIINDTSDELYKMNENILPTNVFVYW